MPKTPTPEEIEAARKLVAEHDAKVAEEQRQARLEAVKPLTEIVEGEPFKTVESLIPTLVEMTKTFEQLRPHVEAIRLGFFGLRQETNMLAAPALAPVPMMPPSNMVIEQQVAG